MIAAEHGADRGSTREQLAALAADAALATRGVVALDPGPTDAVNGVSCTAEADGSYGLRVRVTVKALPLHELGTRIRDAIEQAAAVRGLADELGRIEVEIRDVVEEGPA